MSSSPESAGPARAAALKPQDARPAAAWWAHAAGAAAATLAACLVLQAPAFGQAVPARPGAAPAAGAAAANPYPGVGRPATAAEIAAWDIDVRGDFKGLPAGSGTVARGMEVWEGKCASCHGIFGESNEVFSPLVGGTTREDIARGRVARLTDASYPGRTTMMKLSSLATLWDYIRRAMPWNAPKSLSVDDVYAVTAYMLNMAEVVPENFALSDRNIAEVQQRLPNRLGMTTDHGMWPGKGLGNGGRPDVRAAACMRNCATEATVASFLPDHARNAHGNLAEQNRLVGPQRGADTTRPAAGSAAAGQTSVAAAPAATAAAAAAPAPAAATAPAAPAATRPGEDAAAALALFNRHGCAACHAVDRKVLGPSMTEVARRHSARADKVDYLAGKIVSGGGGVWGPVPMPAQSLPRADAQALARWIAAGSGR